MRTLLEKKEANAELLSRAMTSTTSITDKLWSMSYTIEDLLTRLDKIECFCKDKEELNKSDILVLLALIRAETQPNI